MKRSIFATAVAALLAATSLSSAPAAEKSADDLMPASTLVYAEIGEPNELLNTALDHPLREKLEQIEDIKKALESPQFKGFQFIVGLVEFQLGMKWQEAFDAIAGGGLHAGFDPQTEGVVILAKAGDQEARNRLFDKLLEMARDDAKKKDEPDPIKSGEYRGITAYKIGDGYVAQLGDWLVFSNKDDLAKKVADNYLDEDSEGLSSKTGFKAAQESLRAKPTAWAYIDVEMVRNSGAADDLFREKHDNPAAELLLGGVLATLQKTPYSVFTLDFDAERLALSAAVPHDATWTPVSREYFFGAKGDGAAPAALQPKQALLTIESYRDVGGWWLAKEDLYVENVTAQLAQAESQFSTIFSGLDFGQEVLGAVEPEVQIVLTRQDYVGLETPVPEIKLPAGAMVFRLKEPQKIQRRFKIAYQSFIGFVNIGQSQQGQPQFDMETENRGDAKIVTATYLPEDADDGLINYNFSPSIAFVRDRFVLASTAQLARELVDLLAKEDQQVGSNDNTRVALDLSVLKQVLNDNRAQLVAQNALEKGHSKAAAEKEIGTLIDLLAAGHEVGLRLLNDGETLEFQLELKFAN